MKTIKLFSTIILLTVLALTSVRAFNQQSQQNFVENKGQWNANAKFLAQSPGVDAWLTAKGITYDFYKLIQGNDPLPQVQNIQNIINNNTDKLGDVFTNAQDPNNPDQINTNPDKISSFFTKVQEPNNPDIINTNMDRIGNVVAMEFLNSLDNSKVKGVRVKKGYYNYFIGNDKSKWANHVGLYEEALMSSIYNGVDARIYYDGANLRYDFIIAPKADASQIKMSYRGAEKVFINSNGNLTIKTSIGDVEQRGLYAYQVINGKTVEVECSFVILDNITAGFTIGDYNKAYPLIIDPIVYGTYVSCPSGSTVYEGTVNSTQNAFITGSVSAATYPVTPGAYQTVYNNGSDAFCTKLSDDGTSLVFSTFFGGPNFESGLGVAVDNLNNIYVGGYAAAEMPTTAGAFQTTNAGGNDLFIFKLSPAGDALVYSTYIGGSLGEMGYAVSVDAEYNAYMIGYTPSTNFPVTAGAFQTTNAGGTNDLVVVKLNPTGTALVYSTYIGGSLEEQAYGIKVTADGYCYVAGKTVSTNFPVTAGAFQTTYGGGTWDAVLVKLNQTGTALVYSTYLGGSLDDWGMRPQVDAAGNAYISGYTASTNYPTTAGAFQTTYGGGTYDCFVTKVNPTGTALVYSTYVGGNALDYARGMGITNDGKAVVGGKTASTNFPVSADAFQSTFQTGADDAVFFIVNTTGTTLEYSTYLGGTGSEYCRGIAYDATGNAYPVGFTGSTDFPVTPGAFQTTVGQAGGNNGFVTRFEVNPIIGMPTPLTPLNNSIFVPLLPNFTWAAPANAVNYDFQLATQVNFDESSLVLNLTGLTATNYQVAANLLESTNYYWRVRAHDAANNISTWSMKWTFMTQGDIEQVTLVSPVDEATGLLTNVEFVWNSVDLANNYHLQVSTTEDFSELFVDETVNGTSFIVTGLTPDVLHYWRVCGAYDLITGPWSDVWTFTSVEINTIIIGDGTNYDTDYYNYVTPSPYSNWYTHARLYYLYTADELLTAGAIPNTYITNFGWNIAALNNNGPHYQGAFAIRMKLTTSTQLNNTWNYEDWTTVWEPDVSYTVTLGWNMHQCYTPFFWDGVSSVLIETCFSHPLNIGFGNPQQYWTTTTVPRVQARIVYNPDGPNIDYCATPEFTGWGGTYSGRANIQFLMSSNTLGVPQLASPLANTYGVSITPEFSWLEIEGATSYTLQVSTSINFETIVFEASEIEESQYQLSDEDALNELTIYYWRVKATDGESNSFWSAKWKFYSEGQLPMPTLMTPTNGAVGYPSAKFTWESNPIATGYNFQVSTSEDFENIVIDETGLTENTINSAGLSVNSTYYWRVQMFNPANTSDWSAPFTYSTNNLVAVGIATTWNTDYYNLPSPYANYYAHNRIYYLYTADELIDAGATPESYITNIGWSIANIPGGASTNNPGQYAMKMKLSPLTQLTGTWNYEDWTTIWVPEEPYMATLGWNSHQLIDPFWWDGVSSLLIEICMSHAGISGFPNPQPYETRTDVNKCQYRYIYDPSGGTERDYCAEASDGYSTRATRANVRFEFVTPPFPTPTLISPADSSLSIPLTPLFTWNAVEGAVSYSLQVSTTYNFSDPIINEEGITAEEYQVPESDELDPLTVYYWRVNATDGDATSFWSEKNRFISDGPLPVPTLISPADESTGLEPSTRLTWQGNEAAIYYNLQVATNEDFDNPVINATALSDNEYITYGLSMLSNYYWRVQMYNSTQMSDWSPAWSFSTSNNVVIGMGSGYDTDYYNYVSPSPYSNWYSHARMYFLYTAEELYAAGAQPGAITDFGWNVAVRNSNVGNLMPGEYSIRMKQTPLTALNNTWSYEDWTTVWLPETPFNVVLGWNMHTMIEPFYWDGESSILIETCFNHWERIGNANPQQYWTTTPAKVQARIVYNNGVEYDYCNIPEFTGWGGTYNNRANVKFTLDATGIRAPELLSPANEATRVPTTPLFVWNTSEGATSYGLQVSTNSNFIDPVIDESGLEELSYQVVDALNESTVYYWRMNASNDENTSYWSRPRTFTTYGPIQIVEKISPLDNSVSVNPRTEFLWQQSIGATLYELEIADDGSFNNIIFSQAAIDELSYMLDYLNMLENNTTYFWRVRGYVEEEFGDWSTIWSFTTGILVNTNTYIFTESLEAYPEFSDGTPTFITADDQTANFNLPFTFNYAGREFNDLTISSNGWIALGTTTSNNWDSELSNPDYPAFISPFWEDFTFMASNSNLTYKVEGDEPNRVYAIQYKNVTASGQTEGSINFQLRLHETTNAISFNYGPMESFPGTYWGAGVGLNGLYGGVMDFVSVTPNIPATISSMVPNNNIQPDLFVNFPGRKFVFTPNGGILLDPPVLVSPINGATAVNINPQLSWEAVVDADEYQVQVSLNSNFTNLVVNDFTASLSYNVSEDLEYVTQYWWRVKALNDAPNYSNWSISRSFTTAEQIIIPDNWQFVVTDNFSSIMVPSTVTPMIGDRPMMEGDAIGLFYERTPGNWFCAGYALWNPSGVGIIVYGDDTQTAIKDGYAVNEPYTFRVWDGQELIEYNAYATYILGPEAYEIGGFSMLATLVTDMAVSQDIDLNTGWNMISGYVIPTDPSVETLFEDFVSNLRIMKNSSGQMYVPEYNINEIVDWNNADGYLVNMLGNEVLTLTGEQIVPETTPLNLNFGWNLSAYYRDNPMSPVTALASLSPNLVLAKNNDGGIYSPMYGLNTIGNMLPGQGYYFYMNQAAVLTYPANSAGKAIAGDDITPLAKHLVPQTSNTGNNATLLLSVNVSNGNEIGVYNTNNELIGSGAVYNGVAAVNIWGDNDITANLDGAKANELLTVKLYNANSNTLNDISLINIQEITNGLEQDGLYYNSNAIYLAKATAQNETALVMSITNIPNPVSSSTKFEFSLVNDDNAEIIIYNIRGEEIARLANGFYNAGTYSISFDASNLTSGAYNVVLRSGSQTASTIMMINK